MSEDVYEVYALKYAERNARVRTDSFLFDDHSAPHPMDYYLWVARNAARTVVIDTGYDAEEGVRRGRPILRDPLACLADFGIAADEVETVILTHLHYDHAGGTDAFPKARFHLQDAEAAYATGRCMCHDFLRFPFDEEDVVRMVRLNFRGRIGFHDGMSELCDGLELHAIGGHSAGLQAVRVYTRRGWVVVASDASHFYANYRNRLVFPVVYDIPRLLDGYGTIRRLADSDDHVIPGHDALVMELYPAPSPELEGMAVRLDVPPRS